MKILIFGGNGMLGHVMVDYLKKMNHNVVATYRNPPKKNIEYLKFDAVKDSIPDLSSFDLVINCIGNIKQKKELKAADFYEINSVFPWKLNAIANLMNIPLIHISSDCVFSGKISSDLKYNLNDKTDAEDDYGKSKALGECYSGNAFVIRTSIIGPSDSNCGLFEWFCRNNNSIVYGYENHIWSGVTTLYLSRYIQELIVKQRIKQMQGKCIQLATTPINKYDLLCLFNEIWFEKNPKNIVKIQSDEFINRSMIDTENCSRDIKEQLLSLKEWMTNDY